MWKLSIITDEVSQDIDIAAEFAVSHNVTGLEIRSCFGRGAYELTRADVHAIKRAAFDYGLTVCAIASPFFKCTLKDDGEVQRHMDGLRHVVDIAQALGASIVRGFSFFRPEDAQGIPLEEIAQRYRLILPILAQAGLTLAIENDPTLYAPDGQSLADLVRYIDSPLVRVLWDPGNVPFCSTGEIPYPQGYDAVRPFLAHMHLKDARLQNGQMHAVAIGEGIVDYAAHFAALTRDKYDGYISLETHYRLSHELTNKQLLIPAGYTFSDGGYSSSAHCLCGLARVLGKDGM